MRRSYGKLLRITCVSIMILLFVGSCASLPKRNYSSEEEKLYSEAIFYLEHGNGFNDYYQRAYKLFEELLEKYPGSKYEVAAKIGKADALFKQGKYSLAAAIYGEVLNSYPYDPLSVKAKFMLAECYRNLSDTYDRDLQNIQLAYQNYEEFLEFCRMKNGVNPEFCRDKIEKAVKLKSEMEDKLAKRILYIARFYLKRGYKLAAYERLKELLDKYPDSSVAEDARRVYERLSGELWGEK